MIASDGVVLHLRTIVSGIRPHEVFLDRLGFGFHRPRFFGKTARSIVTQGIYGGKPVDYLDFAGNALCFNTVKGSCR